MLVIQIYLGLIAADGDDAVEAPAGHQVRRPRLPLGDLLPRQAKRMRSEAAATSGSGPFPDVAAPRIEPLDWIS